ncbi:MAG: hypothetical protein H0Z28_04685 [Archaeoglobus sp.]|nr:hypothetical protein [Archaeoglobus sp.]
MLLEKLTEGFAKVPDLKFFCDRCLRTERYNGNVTLMVVDAAFVSIGVNYFAVIVPAVLKFGELLSRLGSASLNDFLKLPEDVLFSVWRNKRSWRVAREIAGYLTSISNDDREALRKWAAESRLEGWKDDPIGRIKGVGINTYQYLRMMGGIDTVMPDKIVRRYFSSLADTPEDDLAFIKWVEELSKETGYRAIELCWLTWFVQYDEAKMKAYRELMKKI